MIEFLKKRLAQHEARRAQMAGDTHQQAQMDAAIREQAEMVRHLLQDQRYRTYAELLTDTKRSLEAEREGLLQNETDAAVREHQV